MPSHTTKLLIIHQTLQNEIFAECERGYPEEACGFVIGKTKVASAIVNGRNIQNELHLRDPNRYPRDARTAYTIDPREMEKVQQKAENNHQEIVAIFHSHPEHGVYFSDEDKAMAAPWGEPLFPNLSYLVVSVYGDKVKNASEFYWDKEQKDFLERKIK